MLAYDKWASVRKRQNVSATFCTSSIALVFRHLGYTITGEGFFKGKNTCL